MAEETTGTTKTADPSQPNEIETQARRMGWKPQAEYDGKAPWVDAETFVRRGEEFGPFIRAENKRLQEQIARAQAQNSELQQQLEETRQSIAELKEFNAAAAAEQLKAQKRKVRAALIEARQNNDADLELQLQEELDVLSEQEPAVKPAVKPNGNAAPPPPDPTQRPEFQQFIAENPWWNENPVMRVASLEIMKQMASQGKLEGLSPAERFSLVAAETKKAFGQEVRPSNTSKVEGTRGPSGGGNGRGYSDLPADARAACDRFAKRMVGPNKAFKTEAEFRKHYAEQYAWE
jgi:hypothetical protein